MARVRVMWGVVFAVFLLATSAVSAQGTEALGQDARALSRAGVGVVSNDGHAALLLNPAATARRGGTRFSLGIGISDHSASYDTDRQTAGLVAPTVRDRLGAKPFVVIGAQHALSEYVVATVGWLSPTRLATASALPRNYDRPSDDGPSEYAQRHAASHFELVRHGIGIGVSVRALPWLAVGASVLGLQVRLAEDRNLWAGTDADTPYAHEFDMALTLRTKDSFVPAAVIGLLAAPVDAPVEFGASLMLSDSADLEGTIKLRNSRGLDANSALPLATADVAIDARASGELPMPLVARAGVRFVGPRFSVEMESQFTHVRARRPRLRLLGVRVTRFDGLERVVDEVPLATALRPTLALRGAVDADVVPGFLAVAVGYGFLRSQVPREATSTAITDLDTHLFAVGADVSVDDLVVSLGVSVGRQTQRTIASESSAVEVLAPFTSAHWAAAGGRYDGSVFAAALTVEMTL